ncbi:hypothetical protein CLAFUW4_09820 [Fulvia fulva]|uniref:DUF7924 domain-containing protein n=1 Tax=Passalora fulva TaxID=5499 RepID=A0A9Q8UU67_PASFU|nr:uncharacterized protein CLAFUR5_12419 [Fulvia fulva]KAK4616971.1 hypothetical protein CLAFUR0_09819 [Fulvia fulva]UJO22644.1 hypothetical protein CLAFUR5_12419 [Fulvia fulva]WPV19299.1 hypothetical protein CLAFUW4_09820 [Fulvia fulva]WPV34372.1 hypothetical protein CLAFUW7_09823 [Fulvia fulva]
MCALKLISTEKIDTLVAQSEHRVEARGPQPETQDSLTSKCIDPELRKKRRRTAGAFVFSEAEKRNAECQSGQFQRKSRQDSNCRTQRVSEQDPIEFWARTGQWLKGFSQMSGSEIDGANKRRRSSTPSYSSRARDGSVPPAYTAAYEEELRRYGIMFNDLTTKDSVTTQSKEMCQALLDVHDLTPAYNSCSEETYIRLFQRASKCGEERIRRDLTPHIVPSAELLYVVDRDAALQNVREELSGDWTRCGLLGGTQLRPDYAYGLSSATFSEEERSKLENYTSINNPTKFTDSMYFPFLLCEAKCGKKNINDADRQNVHSASIAVNAIIQLCRVTGEFHAQRLSGQILVFSISHDNERVKIYGHFPLIRDGCITFHRYYVHDYSLDGHGGRDRNTGTNFTRAVYRTFYPQHLRRIQEAVARLPDPRHSSMISEASVGEGETQASEQSSQKRDITSRPPLRRAKSRGSQGELTLMKQQMSKMEQMYKDQINQQQKQMEKQKDDSRRQMEQQKEDSRRQME